MTQRKVVGVAIVATTLLVSMVACSVSKPVQISFTQHKMELLVGSQTILPLEIKYENKIDMLDSQINFEMPNLIFTSADPQIVTVSAVGEVTAKTPGTTIVTAVVGDCYASIEIEVYAMKEELMGKENTEIRYEESSREAATSAEHQAESAVILTEVSSMEQNDNAEVIVSCEELALVSSTSTHTEAGND